MRCPADDQPCTGDHSASCAQQCAHAATTAVARGGLEARADTMTLNVTKMPRELVEAIDAAAAERMVGRRLLIELFLREGLERLVPVDQLVRRRSDPDYTAGVDR